MQTTPETQALLAELYDRSAIVAELDGPQIEAWVSGLFAMFDDQLTGAQLVEHCQAQPSHVSTLICAAIAELATGLDDELATFAAEGIDRGDSPEATAQIGTSEPAGAWMVEAPFGASVVIGFTNTVIPAVAAGDDDPDADVVDLRHSILVELSEKGEVTDLQLAGAPKRLLEEAAASDDRVAVSELDLAAATAKIVAAWPATAGQDPGPGLASNQQFVRCRLLKLTGHALPAIGAALVEIDVRRGLDDREFDDANRAARSTLQAAVGASESTVDEDLALMRDLWAAIIRGDAGELSARERDALLWLEWADWLGAGIGLVRAGATSPVSGSILVDHVNRCPEVSSTIDKADRDYAEWAFEVALDLLADAGAVADGALTARGYDALAPAMIAAWS